MDIRQGDLLVLYPGETREESYPIRAVADWTQKNAMSKAFLKAASIDCSTKRGVVSDGKTGTPTTNLESLKCIPLMPVTSELAATAGLDSAHEIHQTFIADDSEFVHLIVSETKRTA